MSRSIEVYLVVAFLLVALVVTIAVALCEVASSAERRARRWADDAARREREQHLRAAMSRHPAGRRRTS